MANRFSKLHSDLIPFFWCQLSVLSHCVRLLQCGKGWYFTGYFVPRFLGIAVDNWGVFACSVWSEYPPLGTYAVLCAVDVLMGYGSLLRPRNMYISICGCMHYKSWREVEAVMRRWDTTSLIHVCICIYGYIYSMLNKEVSPTAGRRFCMGRSDR